MATSTGRSSSASSPTSKWFSAATSPTRNGSRRVDLGVAGNLVNQIFSNYQLLPMAAMATYASSPITRLRTPSDVTTYSPYLNPIKRIPATSSPSTGMRPTMTATTGTISGLVRDSVSCKPVAGARITAGSRQPFTDAKGQYSLTLPGGSYSVGAAANIYVPRVSNRRR